MHPLTPWHAPLCTLCNAAIRKSPRTALYIRLLLYRTLAAVDGLFQSSREHDRHLDVAIKDPLGSHGPAQEHRNAGEEAVQTLSVIAASEARGPGATHRTACLPTRLTSLFQSALAGFWERLRRWKGWASKDRAAVRRDIMTEKGLRAATRVAAGTMLTELMI